MRIYLLLLIIVLVPIAMAAAQDRVLIEAVEISGISEETLSRGLRDELQGLKGQSHDPDTANRLADRIQVEFPDQVAAWRTLPGADAGHVRLVFAVAPVPQVQYIVESVEFEGVPPMAVSSALDAEIHQTVGQALSRGDAERFRAALASELGDKFAVSWRTILGTSPMKVKVVYEATRVLLVPFRAPQSFLTYHPKQGISTSFSVPLWSDRPEKSPSLAGPVPGVVVPMPPGTAPSVDSELPKSSIQPAPTRKVTFGLANSGDELVERYKGIHVALELLNVGSERLGLRVEYSGVGARWKSGTLLATNSLANYDLYRARHTFEPSLAFGITRNLYATMGMRWVDLDMQYPATGSRSASAAIGSVHYRQKLKSVGTNQELRAAYEAHTSAHPLDSDFIYTRHSWDGSYSLRRDNNSVQVKVTTGRITGAAPIFERFSIGNTETLRGWNKFDLAPRGGDRVVHGSLEYGYKIGRLFYDSGTVWNPGDAIKLRSSIGLGVGTKERAVVIFAFRIQGTHLSPSLMLTLRSGTQEN